MIIDGDHNPENCKVNGSRANRREDVPLCVHANSSTEAQAGGLARVQHYDGEDEPVTVYVGFSDFLRQSREVTVPKSPSNQQHTNKAPNVSSIDYNGVDQVLVPLLSPYPNEIRFWMKDRYHRGGVQTFGCVRREVRKRVCFLCDYG